jgi:tetratricopeptide (TPR) repeat protein
LEEAMGLAWMQMKSVPEDYPPEKREMVWLAGSAAAWMSASKMDQAKEFLDRLASRYGDQPNVHFLRGFAFESVKDTEAAIAEYSQEVKISPLAATPAIQLALLYSDAGRQDEALEIARRAVALDPGNARSHFALGRVLLALQRWPESAAELEKSRELAPNAAKVHFQLSRVYRKLGRNEQAEDEEAAFEALNKKSEHEQLGGEDPASLNQDGEGRSR